MSTVPRALDTALPAPARSRASGSQSAPDLSGLIDAAALRQALALLASTQAESASGMRAAVLTLLKKVKAEGMAKARVLLDTDRLGIVCARRISHMMDEIISALHDFALHYVFGAANAAPESRIGVLAVGGYGRGTLAPGSDIDLLFLLPQKPAAWNAPAIEYMLLLLWDLGYKVGHATRTIEQCLTSAKADMTIRTAILEARPVCGSLPLAESLANRFDWEVVLNTGPEFVAAKLEERDQRHRKSGDTRYLVEPNVKEGKGGLRDLHTLFWISKYYYRVKDPSDLVKLGVLSKHEWQLFEKAEDFLWAVRCFLHFLTGKAEERLSFDVQRDIAQSLGYQSRPGLSDVERFMKHYFLVAKDVGDLTRILCAALEDQQAKATPGIAGMIRRFSNRARKIPGTLDFVADRGRIALAGPDVFKKDPVNIIRLFHMADIHRLEFHPDALKRVTRSLSLIDHDLKENEEANRLFLSILTSKREPALILRRMNEAGVLGRFIPEFGKIVSMMQFNMYHHYTVDEHLLRSVEVLAEIDQGRSSEVHPLANNVMPGITDRDALFVAVLLHDVAKGRQEDHSIAGAKVARKLCPRLGLSARQTELVAWLIEEHLLMSMVAQTRDLNDRKTITDFAERVQSLERLKLLLILTVCDIRAVGPGVWNGWKGQLLRTLYYETELLLSGGFSEVSRKERADQAQLALADALSDWPQKDRKHYSKLHYQPYLLSVPLEDQVRHATFIRQSDKAGEALATMVRTHSFHAITEITVLSPDHPRLLAVITGACAAAGANIADAEIFTTTDGRALDTIHINRAFDKDEDEMRRAATIGKMIEDVLSGKKRLPEVIATRSKGRKKNRAFTIPPGVTISNTLSNKFTVIEIECLDRTGLLSEITGALADLSLDIASARITTFGEKVIDTFYVSDLVGQKITNENRSAAIVARLKAVMNEGEGDESHPPAARQPEAHKGEPQKKARNEA